MYFNSNVFYAYLSRPCPKETYNRRHNLHKSCNYSIEEDILRGLQTNWDTLKRYNKIEMIRKQRTDFWLSIHLLESSCFFGSLPWLVSEMCIIIYNLSFILQSVFYTMCL